MSEENGGAASPRTEAGKRLLDALIGLGVDNDEGEAAHDIAAIEAEAAQEAPAPEGLTVTICARTDCRWQVTGPHYPHGADDFSEPVYAALFGVQEAPAPEGLRVALATLVDAVERPNAPDSEWLDEAVLRAKQALAATPPTPAEPPRHEHRIEYPSACTGCEHLAAAFVSSAPDWMLIGRAEARPPERLDALRHLFDDEALPDLRPPFEVVHGSVFGDDGDEVDPHAAVEVLNAVAKALGFGSRSAGGATEP